MARKPVRSKKTPYHLRYIDVSRELPSPSKPFVGPPMKITRDNQNYMYVADIPNTRAQREETREYAKQNGRRVVIITDKKDPSVAMMYVSSRFYKSLNTNRSPAFGEGTL